MPYLLTILTIWAYKRAARAAVRQHINNDDDGGGDDGATHGGASRSWCHGRFFNHRSTNEVRELALKTYLICTLAGG